MALIKSLTALLLIASASECAETEAKCSNDWGNHYVCSSFDLSGLPEKEQLSVTIHTENPQHLKKISPKPNVFELRIESSISSLEPDSFKGLAGVQVLILKDNAIPVIYPGTFSDLEVSSLVLQGDQITDIKPGAFKNSKFDLLRIVDNDLKEIKKGAFNNLDLKQLDLFNNKISSIEDGAFADNPDLYVVNLENNALGSFDAKKVFQGVSKLQILNLQNNNLPSLDRSTFEGLKDLSTLRLNANQITDIEPRTFNLPNLRILNLGNNQIKKLDSDVLSGDGLTSMWELYLDDNEFTSLPTSFLSEFPNLRKVALAGNPWECESLDLVLKWIEENLPEGFQEQEEKPTCVQ